MNILADFWFVVDLFTNKKNLLITPVSLPTSLQRIVWRNLQGVFLWR